MEACKRLIGILTTYVRNVDGRESASNIDDPGSVNLWDNHLSSFQSLLIWEDPKKSLLFFTGFTIIYWLMYLWPVGFITATSTIALMLFVHYEWVTKIWPEISVKQADANEEFSPMHPNIFTIQEIRRGINMYGRKVTNAGQFLIDYRRQSPGLFCLFAVSGLCVTLWISLLVSGAVLLYLMCMTLLLTPVSLIHFEPYMSESFKHQDKSKDPDNDLREFLPEERPSDILRALDMPFDTTSDEASQSNTTRFSIGGICNAFFPSDNSGMASFISGLRSDELPSMRESLLDTDIDDNLLPSLDGPSKPLEFTSAHFAESSDDDSFAQGLTFAPRDEINSFPTNKAHPVQSSSEDSDEDFEILDADA